MRNSVSTGITMMIMIAIPALIRADDIDLYTSHLASAHVKPNVLLIIDSSGSMASVDVPVETSVCRHSDLYRPEECEKSLTKKQRLQVVKDVANQLITSLSGINLGIMSFVDGGSEGGFVRKEVVDIDATDSLSGLPNRDLLTAVVNAIEPNGATPLGEVLYEATRYLKGESAHFGLSSSVAASRNGLQYRSPINNACQTNSIILLSDGQPSSDFNHNATIQNYLNADDGIGHYLGAIYGCPAGSADLQSSVPGNSCLVDVAKFVGNNDLSLMPGMQSATLHTIGFTSDLAILKSAAEAGNGHYYRADSSADLMETLNNIFQRIVAPDTTFVAPAVSINTFNRLQHDDEIYYTMFRPSADARWYGNIKKYRINGAGQILDQNNNDAIDSETGYFNNLAHSYWSAEVDGNSTMSGGALSRQVAPRKVFTYSSSAVPSRTLALNQEAHRMSVDNRFLTEQMLGVSSPEERAAVIHWALGYQNDGTSPHRFIGDPLHSGPVVVAYGGSSETDLDTTVFFGTNEGFLHAIDDETGEEQFAFIPQTLLPNLKDYASATVAKKIYGLDGEITFWKKDLNNNRVIYDADGNLESGEGAYLYMGMRRGGRQYFALDVSERDAPKLMWVIDGGTGQFKELGQTWSKPTLGKVKLNGVIKNVLFFGGGYDADQDEAGLAQTDDSGRSLFMVDAMTGALLWSAGPNSSDDLILSEMHYSMPANVTIGDVSNDGLTDVIFASTMGGEVWRFDIDNDANTGAGSFATGGKVLDIKGHTARGNRKFFGPPDVSLFVPGNSPAYFLIAIGSGDRAKPLDEEVNNRFYLKKEYSPFSAPTDSEGVVSYTTTTESHLYDVTDNLIQRGSVSQQTIARNSLAESSGWRLDLLGSTNRGVSHKGEKVISGAITYGGRVIFTSYIPDFKPVGTACSTNFGTTRLHVLDILDGTAAADLDDDGEIDSDDLAKDLQQSGLPAPASIIFTQKTDEQGDDPEEQISEVLCVATECFDDLLGDTSGLSKSYWREDN